MIGLKIIKGNSQVGNVKDQEINGVVDDEREIGKIEPRLTLQAKLNARPRENKFWKNAVWGRSVDIHIEVGNRWNDENRQNLQGRKLRQKAKF